MRQTVRKILASAQRLKEDSGQDLIEYALIVALVAFAATAGMSSMAAAINNEFSQVATTLASYIS